MADRGQTQDPNHPITVEPTEARVEVTVGARVIATSDSALTLSEASYPSVQYIPIGDVDPGVLQRTDHHTTCPYKGEASYYSLVVDGATEENAVWSYEEPKPIVTPIAGHVAFSPSAAVVRVAS